MQKRAASWLLVFQRECAIGSSGESQLAAHCYLFAQGFVGLRVFSSVMRLPSSWSEDVWSSCRCSHPRCQNLLRIVDESMQTSVLTTDAQRRACNHVKRQTDRDRDGETEIFSYYIYMYMYVYLHIKNRYVYIYIYLLIYLFIYRCIYVYVCICTCAYVGMFVCM